MGFQITTNELTSAAIIGPFVGVLVGGWITDRTQRRTNRANIVAQSELRGAQRNSDLYDKLALSATEMIHVLLRQPYTPTSVFYTHEGPIFLPKLDLWFGDFLKASAPLFAYGPPEVRDKLREDIDTIERSISMIKNEVNELLALQQAHGSGAPGQPLAHQIKVTEDLWHADYTKIWTVNNDLAGRLRTALMESKA